MKRETPEERRRIGRKLMYAATLTQFHCICRRPHDASAEPIECECGRTWIQLPPKEAP